MMTFLRNHFKFGHMVQEETSFKDISIFNSGGHFDQWSLTVCGILIRGIMRNISVKLY